jgi:hypothetical protein
MAPSLVAGRWSFVVRRGSLVVRRGSTGDDKRKRRAGPGV